MARRSSLVVVAALALLLARGAAAAPSRAVDTSYPSTALGGRLHFEVYLPPGYATGTLRYPVVYFLHGLPAATTSYSALGYVERALDQVGMPAILVLPQGARPGETDPEYVDHGSGDNWGTAIAQELPRVVDKRFRTIANRSGRALIGESAGGYGAMHLVLEHLNEFSVVESWSGYFHPTTPDGLAPLSLGSPDRDAKADVHQQLVAVKSRLARDPTTIAFYVGRGDSRFVAENRRLDQELTAAKIAHVFAVYPGGHTQSLWKAHAAAWLRLALEHLAPAR